MNKFEDILYCPIVDESAYIIASYCLESRSLDKAAEALAIGQSIGNPSVRLKNESPQILEMHLAKILDLKSHLKSRGSATVRIAFPVCNIDPVQDGITQLLCMLMGGQLDIDIIEKCRLTSVQFPDVFLDAFHGPKYGFKEIVKRCKAEGRPLLGGIVKPKTGMEPETIRDVCVELVKGGVDFIKEDEILGNPECARFEKRVGIVADAVRNEASKQGREVFYAPCINGDYPYFLERAVRAQELGANAVHLNVWAGLPAYRALRNLDLDLAIHFQKSGDLVFTCRDHRYGIDWAVICQIARMVGADFIHAGMWGGYLSEPEETLAETLHVLRGFSRFKQTIASLSCGSHPGLVQTTIKHFGTDLMMAAGGGIHGHPDGSKSGAAAFRQAFEIVTDNLEFNEASLSIRPELKRIYRADKFSEI